MNACDTPTPAPGYVPDPSEKVPNGPLQPAVDFLHALGKVRDGLLVAAAVVYLSGYYCWAVYSNGNNLGSIPALEAQYFTAGIVPALVLAAFLTSVWLLVGLSRWRHKELTRRQQQVGKALSLLGEIGVMTVVPLVFFFRDWATPVGFGAFLLLVAGSFWSRDPKQRFLQRAGLVLMWVYLFLGTFWLLLFYPIYGFQHIPQEWGGPSPRAVQFDLATEHLSPASKKLLLPDGTPPEAAQVQRSRVLYLIFDGGEFVLVARQSAPVGGKDNPVLRIRKATIEGVFPAQEGGQ